MAQPETGCREIVVGTNKGVGFWKGGLRAPGVSVLIFDADMVLFVTLDGPVFG